MNRRCLAWAAILLAFASAGCSSPLDNQSRTGPRDSIITGETDGPPQPELEPPPTAEGSPLDIAIFNVEGVPYSENQAFIEDEIIRACGGTACVNVVIEYAPGAPQSLACEVATIDQPSPTFAGDTITFTLNEPCGEEPPDSEITPETATSPAEESGP